MPHSTPSRVSLFTLVALLATVAPAGAAEPGTSTPDALDRGLQLIGTSRADFRVDPEAMLTQDRTGYRLPQFDKWFCHPLRIPFWERHLREAFLAAKGDPCKSLQYAGDLISMGTSRDLIDPAPLATYRERAKTPDALKIAILALDPKARVPDTGTVPPAVRELAATFLLAAVDAMAWRELALRRMPSTERQPLFDALTEPIAGDETVSKDTKKREADERFPTALKDFYRQMDGLARVDLAPLVAAGDDLAALLSGAAETLTKTPVPESYRFTCATRYGEIVLSGGTDDTYAADRRFLLILDTSGNDTYHAGGASVSADCPLGIIVDAAGNDTYAATGPAPAFGAGVLGWGLLADLAGNDTYTAPGGYSQGCGLAGIGLLLDQAGDDHYSALGNAQGFGHFGIGLLIDQAGHDTYDTYCYAQGCGLTLGFGMLLDLQGNDRYTANDTDIKFPSAQSPQHNCSMAQGAASGDRRDYIDAQSLAGGIGILLDGAGDDTYFAGVFSQAVGYWYGIGILDDRAGNDSYRAVWYGQSATAHFGLSYLLDGAGNDLYTSTNCVNVGAAHDYSVSLFVDEAGDDRYEGASNCGLALNNSVALFVDQAGNDTYAGGSFGQSDVHAKTGPRLEVLTRALFLDLGGTDKYPGTDKGDNRTWTQPVKAPLPRLLGAGLDCENQPLRWDIDPLPAP